MFGNFEANGMSQIHRLKILVQWLGTIDGLTDYTKL